MKGSVRGANRADLIRRAKEIAVEYFGIECVVVDLRDEGSEVVHRTVAPVVEVVTMEFSANFDAQIHHDLFSPGRGPSECKGCGEKSWPHSPLQQRVAVGGVS